MKLKKIFAALLAGIMLTSSFGSGTVTTYASDSPVPVLEVSFDESNAADESGNGNNGTVVGDPEFVEGKTGKAIHLVNSTNRTDTALQYVNFGQPEDLKFGADDFTVMFWYKADASSTTEGAIVSNKYWVSGGNQGFTIGDMKEGITGNLKGDSGSRKDTGRNPLATDNTWHHVAAVIDRSTSQTMKLYIDGRIAPVSGNVSITAVTGSVDSADFLLGASNKAGSEDKFLAVDDAYIDELKVYKTALTQEQVLEIGMKKEDRLVLNVNFDDETAADQSGRENHGIVVGNPEFTQGVAGKAIHLVNSTNREDTAVQYVNFGQPEDLKFGSGSFSVMFWYKASADSQTEGAIVSNKNWISGGNPGFTIGDMKEGVTLNMNTSGCSRKDTSRYSAATDGTWHHIAAVIDQYNTNTMTLYIDGETIQTVDISSLTSSVDVTDFLIGASNNTTDDTKFLAVDDAYIDEFYVYNYAIDQTVIQKETGKYKTQLELEKIIDNINSLTAGERYSEQAIQSIKDKAEEAREELKKENVDKEAVFASFYQEYEDFLEGNPSLMSFHLISDVHVGSDESAEAAVFFKTGLQDMEESNPDADAFVTAGDNTQNGTAAETAVFYGILDENNPVGDEQTLVALGNHDVRGPNSSDWEQNPTEPNAYWSTIYELYMQYNGKYMPENDGATYYNRWIEGYHFIVLNQENSAKDTAWMTQTQLDWLEDKLSENEEPEKPVFVIIHQALNDTHQGSNNYNGFGEQDAAVKEILKKHPQTVLITGHIHNGLGVAEVMDSQYGTLLDVPSFRYNHNGLTGAGNGYEVYVYETELYLRARDFVNHKWMPEYDVCIKLPTLPTLCKEAEGLTESHYTSSSWEAAQEKLTEVLPQAKNMLDQPYGSYGDSTRSEINVIQAKLKAALDLLVESEELNAAVFDEVLSTAKNVAETDVTPSSWEILQNAIAEAERVAEKIQIRETTQAEIDSAVNALNNVLGSMQSMADFTKLQEASDRVTAIDTEKYTEESVAALEKALADADAVLADKNSTQAAVDEVLKALEAAEAALEKKPEVNIEGLRAAIDKAEKIDLSKYEDGAEKDAFLDALAKAKTAVTEAKTQEEADAAKALLEKAAEQLVPVIEEPEKKPIQSVSFNAESINMIIGQENYLKVIVTPADADGADEIEWTSSDEKVLTVDAKGNIKALWPGESVVTAKAGDKSDSIKVTVYGVEKLYNDVTNGDWFYNAANWAYVNEVMSGYGNNTFGPADTLARAQFAVILYRIAGEPEVKFESRFPDVTENDWFADAVIWANDNEIITGYTATGTFGPADNITREQIATILYRYAKSEGYDVNASDDLADFPDAEKVSGFAEDAVKWAVAKGLIKGDNGNLNPQGNTNRAQAAIIIQRFCEAY